MASEVIFLVEESPEGGYEVRALGHPIFTEADDFEQLEQMVLDAVRRRFDPSEMPSVIRLHVTRD